VSLPKPPGGTVPIVIGGHSEVAARRAGRIGDGFFPGRADAADLADLLTTMRQAATDADRDPDTIEVTAVSVAALGPEPLAELEHLARLGVHRVVVPPLTFNPSKIGDALGRFGEDVIAELR
jgi:alkanesulfonate monooxygenase SsuD/methylene tetrahydromethanopterin reductase-like flavin-dependent oxidoreductase (luciferase family)